MADSSNRSRGIWASTMLHGVLDRHRTSVKKQVRLCHTPTLAFGDAIVYNLPLFTFSANAFLSLNNTTAEKFTCLKTNLNRYVAGILIHQLLVDTTCSSSGRFPESLDLDLTSNFAIFNKDTHDDLYFSKFSSPFHPAVILASLVAYDGHGVNSFVSSTYHALLFHDLSCSLTSVFIFL